MENDKEKPEKTVKKQPYWLIYVALLLGGLLLLAHAFELSTLQKWTARLGIALVYSALALVVGNGRAPGYIAVVIVWLCVLLTYLF